MNILQYIGYVMAIAMARVIGTILGVAVIIMVIVLVIVIIANLPAQRAFGATCDGVKRTLIVDRSTNWDAIDKAAAELAIEAFQNQFRSGDRIIIATVAESADASEVLFEGCVPDRSRTYVDLITYVREDFSARWSMLTWRKRDWEPVLVKEFAEFVEDYKAEIADAIETSPGDLPKTALVASLNLHCPGAEVCVALTDGLESESVDVEHVLEGSAELALANMDGVAVVFACVGRFHDVNRRPLTAEQVAGLVNVWTVAAKLAGGAFALSGDHPMNES